MSQLFAWGGQSTRVSALPSVLPKNTQGWSPSEWTGWISLQSKGLSRVFSNTTVQKHQFFVTQPSSQSNSHIHTYNIHTYIYIHTYICIYTYIYIYIYTYMHIISIHIMSGPLKFHSLLYRLGLNWQYPFHCSFLIKIVTGSSGSRWRYIDLVVRMSQDLWSSLWSTWHKYSLRDMAY